MALDVQCVVLAGGLGTRMRPLTTRMPKAMLPVAGRPFADHHLSLLASQGIRRVLYVTGHLGEQLEEYVGDGSRWGLDVGFVREELPLRGTGGALRVALEADRLEVDFFLTYGDSYLPIDVEPVWRAHVGSGMPIHMTVLRNDGRWDVSNVFYDGRRLVYDKARRAPWGPLMRHIDFGLLALRRTVVDDIPAGETVDLSDVLHERSLSGDVAGFEVSQRFFEVGSPAGVEDLEAFVSGTCP